MKPVFADTAFWIALVNPNDSMHEKVRTVLAGLAKRPIVTSDLVLVELLNFFSKRGAKLRIAAARLVQGLSGAANVRIMRHDQQRFEQAVKLYSERSDKAWSLTDCASFQIMGSQGLAEALTTDIHFEQAGFVAVLRESRNS